MDSVIWIELNQGQVGDFLGWVDKIVSAGNEESATLVGQAAAEMTVVNKMLQSAAKLPGGPLVFETHLYVH